MVLNNKTYFFIKDNVVSRPFVISEEFWPQMQDSELELPEKIQKSFDIFKEEFCYINIFIQRREEMTIHKR